MYFTVLHFYNIVCFSDMFKLFAVIVCFTTLKYMILKTLVRTSSFRFMNFFYNVSFIFCCIFIRDLGSIYFFCLMKEFTSFGSAIAFLLYSVCSSLWRILLRCTFSKFSLFQCLGRALLMIINKAFTVLLLN